MSTERKVPRVVVTGIGTIAASGNDLDTFWSNIVAGTPAITAITRFDTTDIPSKVAGQVHDFNPSNYMDAKEAKRTDRYVQLAVAASRMAFADAGLKLGQPVPERFGVIIGSGVGGMETIEEQSANLHLKGPRRVSPFTIPSLIANMAAGIVAIEFQAKAVNFSIVTACAAGSHSIGEAMRHLRDGHADIMLSGGAEAAITRLGFAGFCNMKAMATEFNDNPGGASCPFDARRDGFVMGEGSGVLVLETLEHAQARGARIYAEIVGYGATCDAYHITSPDIEGRGLSACLEMALKDGGVKKEEIDYINAHGTSTPYNDKFETMAFKKVFGEEQARKIAISSTKSMTGHLLGAAGGIEAAIAVKSIFHDIVPPTINYQTPDPDCDLDYVPNQARKQTVNVAISDNLGFGGHNAALIFRKFKA